MECRTLSKLPGVCEWFERHHNYLSGESRVFSKKGREIKQGRTTGKDYEINCLSSFLTPIVIFHCCVTRFSNCKILYREVTGVM